MAFQEYKFRQGRQVQAADMGTARTWETLSNTLNSFSSQMQQKAKVENVAATKAYLDGIESDVITSINKISVDHTNDFDAYSAITKSYGDALVGAVENQAYASATRNLVDGYIARYGKDVYKNTQAITQQKELGVALDNIDNYISDTEFLIKQSIRDGQDGDLPEDFLDRSRELIGNHAEVFSGKVESLVMVNGLPASEAIKLEQDASLRFIKTAAMEEVRIAMENGNGWEVISDFYNNPKSFFSKRKSLSSLIPGASLSEEDTQNIFKEMMTILGDHQQQQDRSDDNDRLALEELQDDNFSDYLDLLVDDKNSVSASVVSKALDDGGISHGQHESLLKLIQSDGLYKEDANTVSEIYGLLYDSGTPKDVILDKIFQAVREDDITPSTQKELLGLLRGGSLSDFSSNEDYQMALNEIKSLRTTGFMAALDQGESKRINQAIRVLYERVSGGEKPLEVIDEIMKTYGKASGTATPAKWNPTWAGTETKPDEEKTKEILQKQYSQGALSQEDFVDQMNELERYMDRFNR